MRQLRLFLMLLLLVSAGINLNATSSNKSFDTATGEFILMSRDGHEEYTVNGSVVFRGTKTTLPSYKDNGVTFSPANPGEIIQATVEEIDLVNGNYLLSYNGLVVTGAANSSDGKDQSQYLPAGWTHKLTSDAVGTIITSSATDGKLTFGYHSGGTSGQKGFKITVSSIMPKDMVFVSASAISSASALTRGAKGQMIIGAEIKTEGINTPLILDEIAFDLSSLTNSQVSNIRAYAGKEPLSTTGSIGTILKCKYSKALASGNNKFYIVADLNPDFVGNIPSLSLSSIKIGGVDKPITAGVTQETSVSNTILMPSVHTQYSIADNADFYDDGGKDGKIGNEFVGSITFIPTTPGNKIKIDFSKLEIFNTSTVGKNDIFNFYNGREAKDENLITTLLKEPKIVKSTADDGSMTVTLKSTTGVPANGWEAIVSQFLPGNMTLESVSTSPVSTESLCAASKDEQFLLLNVRTNNILEPLSLNEITLDASTTAKLKNISNLKVYFLGEKSDFITTNLFGELAVSDNKITISGTQSLKEGSNYFAIVADIDAAALNEDIISIKTTEIKIGDVKTIISENNIATRTVNNTFKHLPGTTVKEMYGDWIFTDTKSTFNSSYYNYEDIDCITTFKPAVPNSVAQISFDSFDVYYASTSYGTKAVFEIYSGTELTDANLLWKLSDNAQSKIGPDKILRSKAADGSITIKFNAKTTYSSSAGKGWKANITPFVNHDMTINDISVSQASTENLVPGSKKQEIISFNITTEGTLTIQKVKSVTIDIKNSLPAIEKATILYSAESDKIANAVEFGSVAIDKESQVEITGEQSLPEGISYLWVAYDIKENVATDIKVDAKLISIKTEDSTPYVPKNGDPDGERLTKNILNLQQGDNGTVTLNNPILFYDNGGADANYTTSFDGNVVFVPSSPDKIVKLSFNSFKTNASHYMYVYAGKGVNEDNLIGKYSNTKFPAELISTSKDGALTVRFVSTSTGTVYAGWEIKAESYIPRELSVSIVNTQSFAAGNIVRGSIDAPLMQLEVTVEGDKGNLSLNNFKGNFIASTDVAEIKDAKLWYTATSAGFVPINQFGETSTSSSFDFNDNIGISITQAGKYYFWLTASISDNAIAGNKISAKATEVAVNSVANTTISEVSKVERPIVNGFKGSYIIGSSEKANYKSIAEAISAMGNSVEGSVTFKLEPGVYAENIILNDISGTSVAHPIIFTSLSGKNDDVIISGAGYSEPAYGEPKYGLFAIKNTNYVTVSNLSIIPVDQKYPYGVHILSVSRNFTLENCIVKADPVLSGYSGIKLFYMEAVNEAGKNNDFVTIKNNEFYGGYMAVQVGGTGFVALEKECGALISGNKINEAGSKAIYAPDESDITIENNIISNSTTEKTGYNAMDLYRTKGRSIIRNNKIINAQNVYSSGLYLRQECQGTTNDPILIYNNVISISNSNSNSSAGIEITSDCFNIHVVNNSININGTAGYPINISKTTVTRNLLVQNNILENNTESPAIAINLAANLDAVTFKNNGYFTTGTKFATNGGDTFTDWQTRMKDAASILEKAEFISISDLHLKTAGNFVAAQPIEYVTTDADGNARSKTNPTLGAYEFATVVIEVPEIAKEYPTTGEITHNSIAVKTKWNQSGKLHAVIVKENEAAPVEETILASKGIDVNKDQEYTYKFLELDEKTGYKAYFVFAGALGKNSVIVSTPTITTKQYIAPLSVELPQLSNAKVGESIVITPEVAGGLKPYAYEWINRMGNVVSTSSTYSFEASSSEDFTLNITSADNQKKSAFTQLAVIGNHAIATFEDNMLAPESFWQGRKDNEEMYNTFFSGSYSFSNVYMPAYQSWGSFAYSNVKATEFNPSQFLTHQFRSVVGHGVDNSNTYAVAYPSSYMGESKISILGSEEGEIVPGVYLTNNAYTYNSIKNGDDFSGDAFKTGDYFKVVFKGDNASAAPVEFYLADFRDSDASKHYSVTDWQWCDLSPLGVVKSINVEIQASRSGTPTYLCMDNFGAKLSSIDNISSGSVTIFPVPAIDILNINGIDGDYTTSIISVDGKMLQNSSTLNGNSHIDVSNLSQGSYLLEIKAANGQRIIKGFLKK